MRILSAELYYGSLTNRQLSFKFAWQISISLQYLHRKGVIYRDLKSSNILLWSLDIASQVNIKLSDYGISCNTIPQGALGLLGTPGFQAPELLKNMAYDEKVRN